MLYNNSAFGPPQKSVLRIGTSLEPNYLFGSFDFKTEPWAFSVTNVSLASNVATVTGKLQSGGGPNPLVIPQVGAKIGIRGTTTNGGAFNVDPATATAVTYNASTGVVSVSYALVHSNVSSTVDVGSMVIQPYETPDLVSAGSASQCAALIFTPDESDNSRCLFAEAVWSGTMPSAASVILQVANVDNDGRYQAVQNVMGTLSGAVVAASDALATIASSAVTQSGAQYSFIAGKFIRAKVQSMTGGDSTTGLVVTIFA